MVGLQGTNKKFKLVGSSTPAWDSDTHELYYRAAFISGEADFEWCEIVLVSYDNGGSAPVTGIEAGCTALGRALFDVPFETKGTGLVWEAEYRVKWL